MANWCIQKIGTQNGELALKTLIFGIEQTKNGVWCNHMQRAH